ncbi:hypothetical protein [Jiella pelagia]|uniref:Uncharacterized protein n=1 Tax=Jiella pelagia TaxID=2986949 RepID=A0ABY7BX61_9HYPH|nr:hypothetical protein [Jiella pelagia]WAP67551.1 hypothetical protein OH818_18875 [Jiella pelagia]
MVEIFSKSQEPRREDARIRNVLQQNRATIVRLADQFSQGRYSASKKPREEPKPQGLIIHVGSGSPTPDVVQPHVRVSVNGRVIVMDMSSGRQLHHLGDVRRVGGIERFRLATRENGYFSPVDTEIAACLADLDGRALDAGFAEAALSSEISARLESPPASAG